MILVLLLATQTVATDLYLPALPQIASDLGRSAGQVQWTLTMFILAQLGAGALVDRYGRRRTVLCSRARFAAGRPESGVRGDEFAHFRANHVAPAAA